MARRWLGFIIFLNAFLFSCIISSGYRTDQPQILEVYGDGSALDRFVSAIMADGQYFTADCQAELKVKSGSAKFDLVVSFISTEKLKLALPADTTEGEYVLRIFNANGQDSTEVTILRGEAGADGQPGAEGPVGSTGVNADCYGIAEPVIESITVAPVQPKVGEPATITILPSDPTYSYRIVGSGGTFTQSSTGINVFDFLPMAAGGPFNFTAVVENACKMTTQSFTINSIKAGWLQLGSTIVPSDGSARKVALSVFEDTLYVAYISGSNAGYVYKYQDESWTAQCGGSYAANLLNYQMQAYLNGTVHVASINSSRTGTVQYCSGNSWTNMGGNFTNNSNLNGELAFKAGSVLGIKTPYVAYVNGSTNTGELKMISSGNWISPFNGVPFATGVIRNLSMDLTLFPLPTAPNNWIQFPAIAYFDAVNTQQIRFFPSFGGWGERNVTVFYGTSPLNGSAMKISYDDPLYTLQAYFVYEIASSYYILVTYYLLNIMQVVNVITTPMSYVSTALYDDNLTMAYKNPNTKEVKVMGWIDNSFVNLGTLGTSEYPVFNTAIEISANGNLYVAYFDSSGGIVVKKYVGQWY